MKLYPGRTKGILTIMLLLTVDSLLGQAGIRTKLVPVDSGWARNSVNTVIFRKNSLVTHKKLQYISFYDAAGFLVIGKRKSGRRNWELKRTSYKGNTADAHNSISMMTDGDGYLHVSWDHHNNPLNYIKTSRPGSLVFTDKMTMTGTSEKQLSYPEFYRMKNGNLLF